MLDMIDTARLEGLHLAQNPAMGPKTIITIHSTRLDPTLGGCHYLPYPNDEAAVGGAIRLAQGMSYKMVLAKLKQGGGKAVITRPSHLDNRSALFEAFGRFIESLGRCYITAVGSGAPSADIDCIVQQIHYATSTTQADDPSPHTTLGVFVGIRISAQARLGSDDPEGLRIVVQGLGHVGYASAEQLVAAGAESLVCDLDPGRVQLTVKQLDVHPPASETLLSTPCNVLAPCGLGGVLTSQSASQLRCATVAEATSNQLERLGVVDELEVHGILYAPNYVINSGGLTHIALKRRGADSHNITAHPARIPAWLTEIYVHVQADHQSPARIADRLAERIFYGPQWRADVSDEVANGLRQWQCGSSPRYHAYTPLPMARP